EVVPQAPCEGELAVDHVLDQREDAPLDSGRRRYEQEWPVLIDSGEAKPELAGFEHAAARQDQERTAVVRQPLLVGIDAARDRMWLAIERGRREGTAERDACAQQHRSSASPGARCETPNSSVQPRVLCAGLHARESTTRCCRSSRAHARRLSDTVLCLALFAGQEARTLLMPRTISRAHPLLLGSKSPRRR